MHQAQIEAVLALDQNARYDYFLRKVADFETAFGLFDREWMKIDDGFGQPCIPLWPELEFAQHYCRPQLSPDVVRPIELQEMLTEWLPQLAKNSLSVIVFPSPSQDGLVVNPEILVSDLGEECRQYE